VLVKEKLMVVKKHIAALRGGFLYSANDRFFCYCDLRRNTGNDRFWPEVVDQEPH
jgi:hypothetical protein